MYNNAMSSPHKSDNEKIVHEKYHFPSIVKAQKYVVCFPEIDVKGYQLL